MGKHGKSRTTSTVYSNVCSIYLNLAFVVSSFVDLRQAVLSQSQHTHTQYVDTNDYLPYRVVVMMTRR